MPDPCPGGGAAGALLARPVRVEPGGGAACLVDAAPRPRAGARQLTEARAEFAWLAAGSQTVQQQALRDFAQAMANFFAGTHRRPTWRKAGRQEGFRIVGVRGRAWDARRLSRRMGEVRVPKVGWVRFRWSRPVPPGVKSFRVTRDRAGRWHVAFAHVPVPVPAPGNGAAVGVDRGVVVSAALSTGQTCTVPGLTRGKAKRLGRLLRRMARAKRGPTAVPVSRPPSRGSRRVRPTAAGTGWRRPRRTWRAGSTSSPSRT